MATFKELRTGAPVYFLSGKEDSLQIRQGVVKKGAGMSHAPTPQPGQPVNYMAPSVVDVEIELDGESRQYEMQDNADYTYGNGMLIAAGLDRILSEVGSLKAQAQERYNHRDKDKACMERCDELLLTWDPKTKEQKVMEDRFRALEESQKRSNENYNDIKAMLAKMMKKFDN